MNEQQALRGRAELLTAARQHGRHGPKFAMSDAGKCGHNGGVV
ncbi:MAG TPA: hypothetical protein VHA06_02790 [Candidatus Angelobacter sp.]|jgi:hypothetical protein|nr:hypothetical protein [Candidatus Angelobacter sp.]